MSQPGPPGERCNHSRSDVTERDLDGIYACVCHLPWGHLGWHECSVDGAQWPRSRATTPLMETDHVGVQL